METLRPAARFARFARFAQGGKIFDSIVKTFPEPKKEKPAAGDLATGSTFLIIF